ncbi:MAG: sigma-70 family RNA polymerase sigma factor, partial [Oscillospiraceae bacterium]|nr:sigma-70 family RNA polymerase sigma factor [Oscillospiraceae bacterium]
YGALRQAVERLPDKERQTIFLRFYHGMTQSQASHILGVSQVQVSRLERRAVKRLREMME